MLAIIFVMMMMMINSHHFTTVAGVIVGTVVGVVIKLAYRELLGMVGVAVRQRGMSPTLGDSKEIPPVRCSFFKDHFLTDTCSQIPRVMRFL